MPSGGASGGGYRIAALSFFKALGGSREPIAAAEWSSAVTRSDAMRVRHCASGINQIAFLGRPMLKRMAE
jgi:hypothetical protein